MASSFLNDLDARMKRAVQQQEVKSLARQQRSKKRPPAARGCLLCLVLSPIAGVFGLVYIIQMYKVLMEYDAQQLTLLAQVEEEEKLRQAQLVRKRQLDQAKLHLYSTTSTLVLKTAQGNIRIRLRPDLSEGSVDYVHRLVKNGTCRRCNFYRAEKDGILQGVMANRDVATNTVLGGCPVGLEDSVPNECPEWDKDCGCRGPIMTRGSVAWAAGKAGGPDFFIDYYEKPAKFWGTQHTNFGFIEDSASLEVVKQILSQPVHEQGGMHHLNDPISFTMSLE